MTFNWGHKLMLGFFVFAGMMIYLVYQSMLTRYDLVSKEYYKDELQYQQIIDGTNRANLLSDRVSVTQAGEQVIIRLPGEMKQHEITGSIWFYRAENAQKDKKLSLLVNEEAVQYIDSRQLVPGKYTVKMSWESNGQQYYTEQFLTIQ